MSVLYVIFLNIMFISYVRSDVLPGVICVSLGAKNRLQPSTKVKISDIPDRCKIVIIGHNHFNEAPSNDEDAAMTALKEAGKTVYMIYKCKLDVNWGELISDQSKLDVFIQPMFAYLKEKSIDGVILSYLNIESGKIPDYTSKINTLISKIRQRVPPVKIGLSLNGFHSQSFNDKKIFDFTLTNTTVDFYVVDLWSVESKCIPDLNNSGGRQPITSDDPDVLTLENVCEHITISPLDKSKLVVFVFDLPTLTDPLRINAPSYSEYCRRRLDVDFEGVWCADTSQILYDRVNFLKKTFQGLMISFLDLDDTTNSCGCGKFPVANTFIDAWEGKPLKICPALS